MKYLVITGDHPRHLHYLNSVAKYCDLVGIVLEKRESFIPSPPGGLDQVDHDNFVKHFKNREKYELEYFSNEKKLPECKTHYFDKNNNLEKETIDFINKTSPDIILIFGVLDYLKKIMDKLGCKTLVNLNTGLIQRYNGDATLFWPFYFLEPNWAGATFHLIDNTNNLNVIHQSVPILKKGDTIHEVASKVVIQASKEVKKIIDYFESNKTLKAVTLKNSGKLFLGSEFIPQHLRVIYNLYNDNIVDKFLDKQINPKEPKLISLINE